MIGPFRGNNNNTVHPAFRRGARIRRNSALKITNSIITDWATGFMLDGVACETNALVNSPDTSLLFQNNIITKYRTRAGEVASGRTFDILGYIGQRNDTSIANSNLLVRPYDFTNPDYRLKTSVNSEDMSSMLQAYPNPCSDVLFVLSNDNDVLTITDLSNKLILTQKVTQGTNIVNVNFSNGIYLLKVGNYTKKIIISK